MENPNRPLPQEEKCKECSENRCDLIAHTKQENKSEGWFKCSNEVHENIIAAERARLVKVVEGMIKEEHAGSCSINGWTCWDECCSIGSNNATLQDVLAVIKGEGNNL